MYEEVSKSNFNQTLKLGGSSKSKSKNNTMYYSAKNSSNFADREKDQSLL